MLENESLFIEVSKPLGRCTDQVVGSDDVAASNNIGVLNGTPGWQKGRTSGSLCSRQSLSWRAPISSISKLAVTRLVSWSPCVSLGDQVVRDRREGDIAERSGKLVQGFQRARVRRMELSDDHSLARGRGKGTVYQDMHDEQVMQIVIAAGETTEKVCMVTPRARH